MLRLYSGTVRSRVCAGFQSEVILEGRYKAKRETWWNLACHQPVLPSIRSVTLEQSNDSSKWGVLGDWAVHGGDCDLGALSFTSTTSTKTLQCSFGTGTFVFGLYVNLMEFGVFKVQPTLDCQHPGNKVQGE